MNDQTPVTIDAAPLTPFASVSGFETAQRVAKALMTSTMVPEHYQNNMGNCLIAMELAARTNSSILAIMQNVYMVYGKPGWSGAYCVAALNASGRYAEPIHYEFKDDEGSDNWGCRVVATSKSGKDICGPWVDIRMAKAEGWYQKKGSKWQTMPELMLRYRAASFFAKTETPELLMGMQTMEELQDTGKPEAQSAGVTVEDLKAPIVQQDEAFAGEVWQPLAKSLHPDEEVAKTETKDITPDWPKQQNNGTWVDKAGVEWDENIHSWSNSAGIPTVNKDGTFRAKRGIQKAMDKLKQHRKDKADAPDSTPESKPMEPDTKGNDNGVLGANADDRQDLDMIDCTMEHPWDGKKEEGQKVAHHSVQEWKRHYNRDMKQIITQRCMACGETWEEEPK